MTHTPRQPAIVVLDDWEHALRNGVDWQALHSQADVRIHDRPLVGDDLHQALREADCVVLFRDRTPLPLTLLRQLPRLRHVLYTGTRNRAFDTEGAQDLGIGVSHTQWGPSKASTCEMTWALILAATRQLPRITLNPQRPTWREPGSPFLPAVLQGKRLGLIGLGQIGQRVAAVGRALGMDVAAWSPHMTPERAAEAGARSVELDELLATSHVVSLHLVPSPATHHLLNSERLARMQPGSLLVNTSRAELIDTDALVQALRAGRPGFAALDVFDTEPLPANHALLSLPNALVTPHYGFICQEVMAAFSAGVEAGLHAWLRSNVLI